MKTCPTCGTEYQAGERFCPHDGTKLLDVAAAAPAALEATPDLSELNLLTAYNDDKLGEIFFARSEAQPSPFLVWLLSEPIENYTDALAQLREEYGTLDKLGNPHIARLLGTGDQSGRGFIAIDHGGGVPLSKRLQNDSRPITESIIPAALDVLDALSAAHGSGILHQDLKPEQLFASPATDNGFRVVVAGYGLRHLLPCFRPMKRNEPFFGTPEYMAPELCSGKEFGPAADLYSMGLVLYALVAGKPPFASSNATTVLKRQIYEKPLPLHLVKPGIPHIGDFEKIIFKALQKDPRQRYQSATEFKDALVAFAQSAKIALTAHTDADTDQTIVEPVRDTLIDQPSVTLQQPAVQVPVEADAQVEEDLPAPETQADAAVDGLPRATRDTLVFSGIPDSLRKGSQRRSAAQHPIADSSAESPTAPPEPAASAADAETHAGSPTAPPEPAASAADAETHAESSAVAPEHNPHLAVATKVNESKPSAASQTGKSDPRKATLMFSGVPDSLRAKGANEDEEVSLQKLGQKYFDPSAESLPGTAPADASRAEEDPATVSPARSIIISANLQEDIKRADQAERQTAILPANGLPLDIEAAQKQLTEVGPIEKAGPKGADSKQVLGDPDERRENMETQISRQRDKFKRQPTPGMEEEWWVDSAAGLSHALGDDSADPFSLPARRKSNRSLYGLIAIAAIIVVGLFVALVATRSQKKGSLRKLKQRPTTITQPRPKSSEVDKKCAQLIQIYDNEDWLNSKPALVVALVEEIQRLDPKNSSLAFYRKQVIKDMLEQGRTLVAKENVPQARVIISLALRIAPNHAALKSLMAQLPQSPTVVKKIEPPKVVTKPEPPKVEPPKVVTKPEPPKVEPPKVVTKPEPPKVEPPKVVTKPEPPKVEPPKVVTKPEPPKVEPPKVVTKPEPPKVEPPKVVKKPEPPKADPRKLAQANYIAGVRNFRRKRYRKALVFLRRALRLNPDHAQARTTLAQVKSAMEAPKIVKKPKPKPEPPKKVVIREDPEKSKKFVKMGILAFNAKKYNLAIRHWRTALKYNRSNTIASKYIGVAQRKMKAENP